MDRNTIDFMVTKFKDNLIGEYDSPSINKLAESILSSRYRRYIKNIRIWVELLMKL